MSKRNTIEEMKVSVYKKQNTLFFEIHDKVTTDVSEAVALMIICGIDNNDLIWKTSLSDIDVTNINIDNTLYWLSGGDREWGSLVNFNTSWLNCVGLFRDRFGSIIQNAVFKAIKIEDIRKVYNKEINISIIYDFAIDKKIVQ
jgi:hypothetical protein